MNTTLKKGSLGLSSDDGEPGQINNGYIHDHGEPSPSPNPPGETHVTVTSGDGEPVREQWDRPIEFLFSCISMSVGLGNIWRFPFTAYENGGGIFLIPYLVVLTLIGRPIYFLEMAMGQFSSYGQVKVWNMAPFFKGVGVGSTIGTACVLSYYCSIMALTIFYFVGSFNEKLPWDDCDKPWGHDENGTCNSRISQNYFDEEVFPQLEHVEDGIGIPEWRLSICLVITWAAIFFSLIKGVKSSGKVAYFTALFPYVVLLILLIQGLTLDGAWKGIEFFLVPEGNNWSKLYEPKVWYEAVSQCFFSLSTGFGPIIMFSSYNPFKHNVYRDALIISLTDTFTSLLAGFTIFAVLGYLSNVTDLPIKDVVAGGPGLAFVSYPAAIARFDVVPQLFAVLFFLMLFTLGIGSATSLAGGIITIICDQFPGFKRWMVTLAVSVIGCAIGLIYVTPGGQFMLTLVDEFGAKFVIYVMATLEVLAVSWVYGLNNFAKDIDFMLGIKIGWYWKFCWGFFIPVFLIIILFYHMFENFEAAHGGVPFVGAALASGWTLAALTLMLIPAFALHSILTGKGDNFIGKLKQSFRPTEEWGPRDPKTKDEWKAFKEK